MTAINQPADTTLQIVRVFAASRERVFDAFVNPEALRVWFCPDGFEFDEVKVSPQTGRGTLFSMTHRDSGRRFTWTLEYLVVEAPARIEWVSTWGDGFPEPGRRTYAVIEFREVPGGTEITLTQEGFVDKANRDDHAQGWGGGLTKLQRFLEP